MTAGWLHLSSAAIGLGGVVACVVGLVTLSVADGLKDGGPAKLRIVGSLLLITPMVLNIGRDIVADVLHGPVWLRVAYAAALVSGGGLIVLRARLAERARKWLSWSFLCTYTAAVTGTFSRHVGLAGALDLARMAGWLCAIALALAPLVWLGVRIMRKRNAGLRRAVAGLVHPAAASSTLPQQGMGGADR